MSTLVFFIRQVCNHTTFTWMITPKCLMGKPLFFAVKLASRQIALCRKRFAAESEVHCILGFGYSWSLTLPFSIRMITLKHARACTCIHALCWFTMCMAKAACLVLLQILQLQRLAQILICGIRIAQTGIFFFQWIYSGKWSQYLITLTIVCMQWVA